MKCCWRADRRRGAPRAEPILKRSIVSSRENLLGNLENKAAQISGRPNRLDRWLFQFTESGSFRKSPAVLVASHQTHYAKLDGQAGRLLGSGELGLRVKDSTDCFLNYES